MPAPKGRMLRVNISKSRKFASLSPDAQRLFVLMIPHLNSYGKMEGQPEFIKGKCVPLLVDMTIPKITKCLSEISEKTSVKWFEHEGLNYLHCLSWEEHQELREDRLGHDSFPDYSRNDTGSIPLEVEVEGKDKVEAQVKDKGDTAVIPEDLKANESEILNWLTYKQERRESYKPAGLSALWGMLRRIPADRRKEAIEASMASNYAGIFPPKGGQNGTITGAKPVAGKYAD